MSHKSNHYHLANLTQESVPEIFEIEYKAHRHPMSESNIASCFGQLYHNIGIYQNDLLVGFAIVHQVVDEATLMDICITPEVQGLGLGKTLMDEVIKSSKVRDAVVLQLEVRASNNSAIELYKKANFTETGCRTDYYPTDSGREDAVLMELRF